MKRRSIKKSIAARTSFKRYVRHNLGFKAPRGWGWLTNPKKASYNRSYYRRRKAEEALISALISLVFIVALLLLKLVIKIAISILVQISYMFKALYQRYRRASAHELTPTLTLPTPQAPQNLSYNSKGASRLRLKYRDVKEDVTERDIDVVSIKNTLEDKQIVMGFCHLRGQLRSFRVDRIVECVDIETGEMINDVWSYLSTANTNSTKSDSA